MRKGFLCALLLFLGVASNVFCQRFSKSQFTLFSLDFSVDNKVLSEIKPFENLINYNPEKTQDKVIGMLTHSLYEMTSECLTDTLNVYVVPINSLGNKAKYDDYGYPDITIQKAIKLSDTKYYFKIEASLKNKQYDESGKKIAEDVFQPELTIKIDLFNKNGLLPIKSTTGTASAMKPVTTSKEFISGMRFVEELDNGDNTERLRNIYKIAIREAVMKLKYKNLK
jgi:hypothetical protein